MKEWKGRATGRGRVKEILMETTEFAKANDIADRTLVSGPTPRKYLDDAPLRRRITTSTGPLNEVMKRLVYWVGRTY